MLGKANWYVSSLSIQASLLFSMDNNWFQVFSQSLLKFKILDCRCSFYKFCFISTLHFCSCISRKFFLCSFYKFCFDGTYITLGQQIQCCPWMWWKWDVKVVSRGGRTRITTLERVRGFDLFTWFSAMSVCNPYLLVYLEIRNNTKG